MRRPSRLEPARIGLIAVTAVVFMMNGCSGQQSSSNDPSQQLLAAPERTANWSLVEEERTANPEARNLAARKQVNPAGSSEGYTTKPDPDQMDEPMHFRVLKLERQMADLQGNFDKLLPPLNEVAELNGKLEAAIGEIKTIQQQAAMTMPDPVPASAPPIPLEQAMAAPDSSVHLMTPAPAPQKPVPAAKAPAQAASASVPPGLNVTGLRVGEHPGKMRIVLDLTGPAKFTTDLDNNEKILLVDLPDAAWAGAQTQKTLKNSMIKGYTVQKSATGKGTTLAIELQKTAKLVDSMALSPGGGYGNRIALDLAPL